MASKYDITSGLTEYQSHYHDIGVDKYIDAVKSLRDTYDRNVSGINLVNEAVQTMEFMPEDEEVGRSYLSNNITGILGGAMDAPEEATLQVNKAAQFFTSDPTASQYRRNSKEWLLTKEIAMNTPGGWSSMIMFGDNPFTFKTVNEDGTLNQYVHQAEGRLNQEGKFIEMVGNIAQDTSILGPEFKDITGDNIADILVTGSSTGVKGSKADRIAMGIMDQFIQTAEGRQAMRELMEPVGGKPAVTSNESEAKRLLYERFRPLIENQVGMTRNVSSQQLTASSQSLGKKTHDIYGTMPSLIMEILQGDMTSITETQREGLGLKNNEIVSGGKILTDYNSVVDLGYLGEVSGDYQIVPGFQPFQNLEGDQKGMMALKLMQVLETERGGDKQGAWDIAKTIPGFAEAAQEHGGTALMAGIQTYVDKVTRTGYAETKAALGVMLNANVEGARRVNTSGSSEIKTINRGGESILAIKERFWVTEDQLNNFADQAGAGTTGYWVVDLWETDIDQIKHPRTGKKVFREGQYDGEDGYYFDVWTEMEVNTGLQEEIDQNRVGIGDGDIYDNAQGMRNQIKALTDHVELFQKYKQSYVSNRKLMHLAGYKTVDGIQVPEYTTMDVSKHITPGSALDLKVQDLFDKMPKATVAVEMSLGMDAETFTANIMLELASVLRIQGDREAGVQKIIDRLKQIELTAK